MLTPMAYQPVDPDDESPATSETGPSFADILSEYEQGRPKPREEGAEGRDGVVVAVSPEFVFVDIGLKTEGVIEAAPSPAISLSPATRSKSASRDAIRKATTHFPGSRSRAPKIGVRSKKRSRRNGPLPVS